jgi:iron complex transport system substrate-binding protein
MPSQKALIIITIAAFVAGVAFEIAIWPEDRGNHMYDSEVLRVISLSPAITEIVFAIGEGGRVVGVSDWTKFPPEAAALPNCGGVANTNYELISKLKPDLVIIQGESADMKRRFGEMGIKYLGVTLDKIGDIGVAAFEIADALGVKEKGEILKNHIASECKRISGIAKNLPITKVLLVTWRDAGRLSNICTMGPGGFLDEAVAICGGENIFRDSPVLYTTAPQEKICTRAPDVIIEMRSGEKLSDAEIEKVKNEWNDMPSLPAVQNGRIFVVTDDYATIPGPRIADLLKLLASIIHPEADWSAANGTGSGR